MYAYTLIAGTHYPCSWDVFTTVFTASEPWTRPYTAREVNTGRVYRASHTRFLFNWPSLGPTGIMGELLPISRVPRKVLGNNWNRFFQTEMMSFPLPHQQCHSTEGSTPIEEDHLLDVLDNWL